MNHLPTISLQNLAIIAIPALLVLLIMARWKIAIGNGLYALFRMLLQLLLVGYVLNYIFASDSPWITLTILLVMVVIASWIALNTVKPLRFQLLFKTILSLSIGGGITFALIVGAVLELEPWYQARYAIPLGGMIFANIMTGISLCADRFYVELESGADFDHARNSAFNTALIPTINMLFAVGLVSLPGMMTGQILSGVSPFIAARYQIMVMVMIFAASGLSTACFLSLIKPK